MNTTVREAAAPEPPEALQPLEWAVLVVHHPDAKLLGLRRVLPARAALDLGRESGALGERTLDDPLVSRQHARIEVDARGAATVSDLGSANGTWVDGVRVGAHTLRAGSVLRVGPILLYVQRAPASYALRRSERAPVLSYATARFVEGLRAAVARRGVLFVAGAPEGAWAPYLAQALVDAGLGEARAFASPEEVPEKRAGVGAGKTQGSPSGWLAHDDELRARGALWVCALGAGSHEGALRERTLTMPRLTERGEELPWLAREGLARAMGAAPPLDHTLVARMLRASWPEDVTGLTRWCEAVAKRTRDESVVRPSGEDLAHFGEPRALEADALGPESEPEEKNASGEQPSTKVRAARGGGWFCVGDEPAVDLRVRFALARLLAALVKCHEGTPGEALSIEKLVEAGWPGEKMVGDSGANRVYVAIATLRKLGLRECIERREGAYRLSPEWRVEIEASENPPGAAKR